MRQSSGGAEAGGKKPAGSSGLGTCMHPQSHSGACGLTTGIWEDRARAQGHHLSKWEATDREIPRAMGKDQGEPHRSYAMA